MAVWGCWHPRFLAKGEETSSVHTVWRSRVAEGPSSPIWMGCYSIHPSVRQGPANEPRSRTILYSSPVGDQQLGGTPCPAGGTFLFPQFVRWRGGQGRAESTAQRKRFASVSGICRSCPFLRGLGSRCMSGEERTGVQALIPPGGHVLVHACLPWRNTCTVGFVYGARQMGHVTLDMPWVRFPLLVVRATRDGAPLACLLVCLCHV